MLDEDQDQVLANFGCGGFLEASVSFIKATKASVGSENSSSDDPGPTTQ